MYKIREWNPMYLIPPSPVTYKSNNVNIGVASLSKSHESMLPVITANIFGPENIQKRVNVLFDSGAQVSLIRQQTADCLGLKGKGISVTITKVRREEEMKTKVYRVPGHITPETTQVLFLSKKTSLDLAEFRTTESMGVEAKPCICEADKL